MTETTAGQARAQTLLGRLRERPRTSICVMAAASALVAGSYYVVLIATSSPARAYLGSNPAWLMLVMAIPYVFAGLVALAMTLFPKASGHAAVHAMVGVTGISVAALLWKLPHLDWWRGDMQGLGVLLDLAIQGALVLLAFPVAGVITWLASRSE
jgi:hypothetical protein